METLTNEELLETEGGDWVDTGLGLLCGALMALAML